MIPDYQRRMLPVLPSVSQGEARVTDVIAQLAEEFQLTEAERSQMLPSGRATLFANRVHWAKSYLKQAGHLLQTRRAHIHLSEKGEKALSSGLSRIDNVYLSQFPEFQEFKSRSRDDKSDSHVAAQSASTAEADTPDEIMRRAHKQVLDQLRAELLERVIQSSPEFFEHLIVELIVSMGFGGSVEAAGRAIGKTGDNGVDGVIDQDALGLDRVYIQAKRYTPANKIPSSAIRDFFGSLDRFKAAKGVFVTTSDFTKDAEETAKFLSKRIVFINGVRLGDLMIRYNVGCRIEETLHVKKVYEDLFFE